MSSPSKQLSRLIEETKLLDHNSPHVKPPPNKRAPLESLLPSPMDIEPPQETPFLPTMDDLLNDFIDDDGDANPSDKENVPESSPAPPPLFHGLTFYLVEYPGRSSVERRSIILTGGGRITKQIKDANIIIFPFSPQDQLPPGFQEIVHLALPCPCVNYQWLINSLAKGGRRPVRNYVFPPFPQLDQDDEQEAAIVPAHRLPTPPMRLFGTSPSPLTTKASHDSLFSGPSTVPSPSKPVDSRQDDEGDTLRADAAPVEPAVDGGGDDAIVVDEEDDKDDDEEDEEISLPPSPTASEWLPPDESQPSSGLSSPPASPKLVPHDGKDRTGSKGNAQASTSNDDPDSDDEWIKATFGGRTSLQSPLKPSPFDCRRIPKSRHSTEPQSRPATASPRRRARTTLSESPDIPLATTRKCKTGVTGRLGQACGRPINAPNSTAAGQQAASSKDKQGEASKGSGKAAPTAPPALAPSATANKETASAPQPIPTETAKDCTSAPPPQPRPKPVDPVQRVKQLVEKEKEKDEARKAAEQEAAAQKAAEQEAAAQAAVDQEKEASARRAAEAMVSLAKTTGEGSRTSDAQSAKGRDPPTRIPVPSTPTSSRTKEPSQAPTDAPQADTAQQGMRRSWRSIAPKQPPPPVHTRHQSLPVDEAEGDQRQPISRRQSLDAAPSSRIPGGQSPHWSSSSSRIPGGQSPHWSSGRAKPPAFKLNPQARSFAPPAITSAPPSAFYPRQTFRNQFFADPNGIPLGRPPLQKRSSNDDYEVAGAHGLPPRPIVDSSKDPRRRPASVGAVPISGGSESRPVGAPHSGRKRLSDANEEDSRKRSRPTL